jgi:histidinol-phosphate/aromatic aminotransferase/cobyric acid decarboxylase-like protein
MPLAIDSYRGLGPLGDGPGLLNLAWTVDERPLLAVDLDETIAAELKAEVTDGLPFVKRYSVDDPYGEAVLGSALSTYFVQSPPAPFAVAAGAGVISLLQSLAALARGSSVCLLGDVYPDFPFWVEAAGASLTTKPADADLIFCERPSIFRRCLDSLDEVRSLCQAAEVRGATVLIDESNANYQPPEVSSVRLIPELDNLIVLRGLSKGYGMGGLRLGLAIASESRRPLLREVVPPLLASSLSLRIGARLLMSGDVAAPLRERIRANRAGASARLSAAGFEVMETSAVVPYLFLGGNPDAALAKLEVRGIRGKSHMVWVAEEQAVIRRARVSVPLADERMQALRKALASRPSS